MGVILEHSLPHLGNSGSVVSVAPGYARNYLVPTGRAMYATEVNKHIFEEQKEEIARSNREALIHARNQAGQLEGTGVAIVQQAGEDGRLYGAVLARDVALALSERSGIHIDRRSIQLDQQIRFIGGYTASVTLHPEVVCSVRVVVVRNAEDANAFFASKSRDEDSSETVE